MTDDDLRKALAAAHRDDAPPPLPRLLARPRRPRRAWLLLVPAVAAGLVALAVRPGHRPPPSPRLEISYPLDFLLDVPGEELLRDTPRFELKGPLP